MKPATFRRATPRSKGAKRPWTLVIALTAIYAYAFADRVILALMVEPIKAELHIGDVQMSLLLGLAFAGFYAILNLPAGYVVDKANRRALIGFASLVWAAMTLCCALARNFNELFLARAGVGLAEAVMSPAAFSLIRDAVPEKSRGMAFSLYAMAPIIGGGVALAGGGFLLHAVKAGLLHGVAPLAGLSPWRAVLILIGLLGAPLSLLLLSFREPPRGDADPAKSPRAETDIKGALAYVQRQWGAYVALVSFVTFGAMMTFGQSAWLPAMLGRKWALAPDRIGPMLGVVSLGCGLVGLGVSGYVIGRLTAAGRDIRLYGALAAVGTAVGLAGAALAPSLPAALMLAGLGLFFGGASFPIGAATLSEITPAPLMGKIAGGYLLLQTLAGQGGGPVLIAAVSERMVKGPMALPYAFALMMSVFGAAATIAAYALRSTLRHRPIAVLPGSA